MDSQTYYQVQFASFSPIYVWEWNANNAVIRAKYQRLEEKLSTEVVSVFREHNGAWINCGISDFAPQVNTTTDKEERYANV